ncbi:MAG: hypothetical protein IJL87_00355 [Clostridia bacterium]|nr:hypothetical protein [Clostridia bacterium]
MSDKYKKKIAAKDEKPAFMGYPTEPYTEDKPISNAYRAIDNDLARDNLENDIPAADLQDI